MTAEYLSDGSPDCPLVRLFAFSADEAAKLQAACRRLADGELGRFGLTAQPWCEPVGTFRLSFVVSAADLRLRPAGAAFEWAITGETWSDVADRIEPFTTNPVRGYQWLDEDDVYSLLLSHDGRW